MISDARPRAVKWRYDTIYPTFDFAQFLMVLLLLCSVEESRSVKNKL